MDTHFIYEVCAVIATLAFIVIAYFLVITLKSLVESLNKLNSKIEPITNETLRLLENSNEMVESVQDKLSDLDPLVGSIANVGSALQNATSSLNEEEDEERPHKFFRTEKKKNWQNVAGDLIKLISLGVVAWQKLKKGR
jgi:uncharacterized protein YoxC